MTIFKTTNYTNCSINVLTVCSPSISLLYVWLSQNNEWFQPPTGLLFEVAATRSWYLSTCRFTCFLLILRLTPFNRSVETCLSSWHHQWLWQINVQHPSEWSVGYVNSNALYMYACQIWRCIYIILYLYLYNEEMVYYMRVCNMKIYTQKMSRITCMYTSMS